MIVEKVNTIQLVNPNYGGIFNVAFDFLKKGTGESLTVLDGGCGNGRNAETLRKMGFKVTGIDISDEDIQFAKTNFPENSFFQFDLNNALPFADKSFDIIISNSVFQYIDWQKVIREYKRVVKPDGQLLLMENLRGNPFAKIYRFMMSISKSYKKHFIPNEHMDYKEIDIIAENFKNIEIRFCVLFSTIVVVLPRTPKFGLRALRLKVRYYLVNLENKLLVRFPGLRRYCSKVIVYITNPK